MPIQHIPSNTSARNVINVKSFGAAGSVANTTGSITYGSNILTLNAPIDFENGQGIFIANAGHACTLTTPTISSISTHGSAGSSQTTYQYQVIAIDSNGGYTQASAVQTVSWNSTLSSSNYVTVNWGAVSNVKAYAVYGKTSSSMNLLAITDYHTTSWSDQGQSAITTNVGLLLTPPTQYYAGNLLSTIVDGAGSTTLVLHDSATTSISNTYVTHDDTNAIQTALNHGSSSTTVYFPPGNYIANNLTMNANSIIDFDEVTLTFPSWIPQFSSMLVVGNYGANTASGTYKIGGQVTIDGSAQVSGKQTKGILIYNAFGFEIDGVTGYFIPDGYTVQVTQTWGNPGAVGTFGKISNVHEENNPGTGWGAVAISGGQNITVENVWSDNNIALDVEVDITTNDFASDIYVKNVYSGSSIALSLTAHQYTINRVRADGIYGGVSISHSTGGSLSDITLENGYCGPMHVHTRGYGVYSPNDTIVPNLVIKNFHVDSATNNGFQVSGAVMENCVAENCGLNGFSNCFHTQNIGPMQFVPGLRAKYIRCKAINCNTSNSTNKGGFYLQFHERYDMVECEATDATGTLYRGGILLWHGTCYVDDAMILSNYNIGYYKGLYNGNVGGFNKFQTQQPSIGYYHQGDVIRNVAPVAGSYASMMCTNTGFACNNPWTSGTSYNGNSGVASGYVYSGNNVYYCTGTGVAGGIAPVGTGTGIYDGGATWSYAAPLATFSLYDAIPIDVNDVQLTTTSATNLITFTPSIAGSFYINTYYRTTANTNLTINVTFTDNSGSVQTLPLLPQTSIVGTVSGEENGYINVKANTAITITATSSVANVAYVSASLIAR